MDDTIHGFWRELERDTDQPDLWRIYCDYLLETEHEQAEITQLWVENRYATLSDEASEKLTIRLSDGLRPLLPRRSGRLGIEMVLVPKGTFWMSHEEQYAVREVTIENDFYLGIYQITQQQWTKVMGTNPSYFSREGSGSERVLEVPDEELSQFPVDNVSWDDIQVFLRKLNDLESPDDWIYRLPSEAEWEYACRSALGSRKDCEAHFYFASPTTDLSSHEANFDGGYPGGNAEKAHYYARPRGVGSYESNVLGIYDMHGNLDEWCADGETVETRFILGGSWHSLAEGCRASARFSTGKSNAYDILGFRVALSLSEASQVKHEHD